MDTTAIHGSAPPLTTLERVMVFVLRFIGVVELLAFVAVLMPFRWSVDAHAALGMGVLPRAPIVPYLIRSASLLYAVHGAMMLYLAIDVRRYSRFISFVGVLALIQGILLLFIDYEVGVPKWWMLAEPAVYWAMASVILLTQQRIRRARAYQTQLALNRSA